MVWIAYSRTQKRPVAYLVGDQGVKTAQSLYSETEKQVGKIGIIYTDANSCYAEAFKKIKTRHIMTKAETHLIESLNSSIRDNLARFNRRTKRFSKSWEMLIITLFLFLMLGKHAYQH